MSRRLRLAKLLAGTGLKAAPGLMIAAFLAATGSAVAGTLFPIGFKLIVDGATNHDQHGQLILGAAVVAVLFPAAFILGVTGANLNGQLTDRVNLYLGMQMAGLISAAPRLEHFERQDYLARIDQLRDNRRTLAGAPRQLLGIWQTLIRGSLTVVLLATVYPPVLIVPLFGIAPALADRRASRVQQRSNDELSQQRRLLNDLFTIATTAGPARELRTYGIADAVATRHHELGEQVRRRSVRAALRSAAWEAFGWALFAVGFVGAVVVLVLRAAHGHASPGQVVMSVSLLRRSQRTVSSTTDTAGSLGTSARTAGQMIWLEDYVAEPGGTPRPSRPAPNRLSKGITLEQVSFTYPTASEPVLIDVDLHLPAGCTVALVGENGAGKTTLVKLLAGMYAPTSGRVRIDDEDLAAIDPAVWRERTTATFQDFVRFELPAQQSVGVGELTLIDDQSAVVTALKRSGGEELVDELPDGLQTRVGSRFTGGRELSGGQWQRVALARGLMRSAPLLTILDEPTASLDAPTESALFDRYADAAHRNAEANGAITLLVTHRFSTVHSADLIVVLEHGRVIEVGSHRSLMKAGGLYAQLYNLQASALLSNG